MNLTNGPFICKTTSQTIKMLCTAVCLEDEAEISILHRLHLLRYPSWARSACIVIRN